MQIYEKVKKYIVENGLKQVIVAKKAGISAGTLSSILNGKRTMYAEDLRALCCALNISAEAFMDTQKINHDKKRRIDKEHT
jgi:transcriptional regulator with XRE-family HTH domain